MLTEVISPGKLSTIYGGKTEPKLLLNSIGREEYMQNFAGDKFIIDKSTSYFDSQTAPINAFKIVPEAKILAILRNPVDRAISHWAFSSQNDFETKSLLEIAANEKLQDRSYEGVSASPFQYLERGHYAKYLRRWYKYFKRTRIKILILEEIVSNPNTLQDVLTFLLEDDYESHNYDILSKNKKIARINSGTYAEIRTKELNQAKRLLNKYYYTKNLELEDLINRKIQCWD